MRNLVESVFQHGSGSLCLRSRIEAHRYLLFPRDQVTIRLHMVSFPHCFVRRSKSRGFLGDSTVGSEATLSVDMGV